MLSDAQIYIILHELDVAFRIIYVTGHDRKKNISGFNVETLALVEALEGKKPLAMDMNHAANQL